MWPAELTQLRVGSFDDSQRFRVAVRCAVENQNPAAAGAAHSLASTRNGQEVMDGVHSGRGGYHSRIGVSFQDTDGSHVSVAEQRVDIHVIPFRHEDLIVHGVNGQPVGLDQPRSRTLNHPNRHGLAIGVSV